MVQHLACIMDGNRRFAVRHGWKPWIGHQEGIKAVQRAIDFCLSRSISYLSLYAFSTENFKRSPQELSFLWDICLKNVKDIKKEAIERRICIRCVGDRSLFPDSVLPAIIELEKETAHGTQLRVDILFCYGARQEMVHSIKKIVNKIRSGLLSEENLSEAVIEEHLWTQGTPPPDLIVRTGGRKRLSNFLLYQAAYSELYFLDCLWPEITESDLAKAVAFFEHSERNFGV